MARLARLVLPGIPYHVTQRGNRRQQTFFEDGDYALYRACSAKRRGARPSPADKGKGADTLHFVPGTCAVALLGQIVEDDYTSPCQIKATQLFGANPSPKVAVTVGRRKRCRSEPESETTQQT